MCVCVCVGPKAPGGWLTSTPPYNKEKHCTYPKIITSIKYIKMYTYDTMQKTKPTMK